MSVSGSPTELSMTEEFLLLRFRKELGRLVQQAGPIAVRFKPILLQLEREAYAPIEAALRQYDEQVDVYGARALVAQCVAEASDATIEEIVAGIHFKGQSALTKMKPAGFLILNVPDLFTSLNVHRFRAQLRFQQRPHEPEAEMQYLRQWLGENRDHPGAGQWRERLAKLESQRRGPRKAAGVGA